MVLKDKKLNYPRPQFIREKWKNLNGNWDFEFDDKNIGKIEKWYEKKSFSMKIEVPYVYQSKKSGININEQHNIIWYKKKFIYDLSEKQELLLHFEAVDYESDVWINGIYLGKNIGGWTPFSFNLTHFLIEGENEITIRVEDYNKCTQLIGKQSWKDENFLCWYTRTVGIWQQVWLEEVGNYRIKEFKLTTDLGKSELTVDMHIEGASKKGTLVTKIFFESEIIREINIGVKNGRVKFTVDISSNSPNFRVNYWSPSTPNLYDINFLLLDEEIKSDYVESYFGVRSIEAKNGMINLNTLNFYQKLILDQGYYEDSLMTATVAELYHDLKTIKEMGFNGVRKHQKIEDSRYMYLCDKLGLVMWAEMPSPFEFSIETMDNILRELPLIIKKHWNHPSVIVYTLMNESWGVNEIYKSISQQNFVNSLYDIVKAYDNNRLIIGNDGWEHVKTDILAIHDYNSDFNSLKKSWNSKSEAILKPPSLTSMRQNFAENYTYSNQPIIISEFGGIAYDNNSDNEFKDSWGYGDRPKSKNEAFERFKNLMETIMSIDYLSGFCYTQLTDVEQEVNGLLDYKHNSKFDIKLIRKILDSNHCNGFIFK